LRGAAAAAGLGLRTDLGASCNRVQSIGGLFSQDCDGMLWPTSPPDQSKEIPLCPLVQPIDPCFSFCRDPVIIRAVRCIPLPVRPSRPMGVD